MADFCSKCDKDFFDIGLTQLALDLERGRSINFLCVKCNKRCIYKDDQGLLYIGILFGTEMELRAVKIEEL